MRGGKEPWKQGGRRWRLSLTSSSAMVARERFSSADDRGVSDSWLSKFVLRSFYGRFGANSAPLDATRPSQVSSVRAGVMRCSITSHEQILGPVFRERAAPAPSQFFETPVNSAPQSATSSLHRPRRPHRPPTKIYLSGIIHPAALFVHRPISTQPPWRLPVLSRTSSTRWRTGWRHHCVSAFGARHGQLRRPLTVLSAHDRTTTRAPLPRTLSNTPRPWLCGLLSPPSRRHLALSSFRTASSSLRSSSASMAAAAVAAAAAAAAAAVRRLLRR